MALLALITAAETVLFSASCSKRGQRRRQQVLMGNSTKLVNSLPFLDEYFKRKTAGASRLELFVASKLADACRHVVHARSFEYVLVHVIRSVVLKRRKKLVIPFRRVSL
jgi:hypothetical protein